MNPGTMLRKVKLGLSVAGLLVLLAARSLDLALYLKTRLLYAKWRNKRKFRKILAEKGVPSSLIEELAETYDAYIEKHMALPGLITLASSLHAGKHKLFPAQL